MNKIAMIEAFEKLHGIAWDATALSVRTCWTDAWNAATAAALSSIQPPGEPVQTSAPTDTLAMDWPADWLIADRAALANTVDRIDIPAFLRHHGIRED